MPLTYYPPRPNRRISAIGLSAKYKRKLISNKGIGNAMNHRESKAKRQKPALLRCFAAALLFACAAITLAGCAAAEPVKASKSYSFAPPEYITATSNQIKSINVQDYLPSGSFTAKYQYPNDSETYTSIEQYTQGKSGVTYSSSIAGVASTGRLYYDRTADCLANSHDQTGIDAVYLIPMGKSYTEHGVTIQPIDRLFTVETPSGTYSDCACVLETEDGQPDHASYYAKGIGKILTVVESESSEYFQVTSILQSIQTSNKTAEKKTVSEPGYAYTNYLKNGSVYTCPATGASCIVDSYEDESTGEIVLSLSFDNGDVTGYSFYSYSRLSSDESDAELDYIDSLGGHLTFNTSSSSWFEVNSSGAGIHDGMYELSR